MGELTVIPTESALGAQVLELDLRRPLDTAVQEQLRAAFTAHSVLLCRDQQLSQADQLSISRCFGEPIPHPTNTRDRDPEYPAITILSNIKENGRPVGALGNDEVTGILIWFFCICPARFRCCIVWRRQIVVVTPGGPAATQLTKR